jgi:PTH1 family peptidyl-tRNA hydrolase
MKYLVFGLGNVGQEYQNTRHNIGFDVVDFLANEFNAEFELKRHGFVSNIKFKGRTIVLVKPTTFMNLSGKAIKYWMQEENVDLDKILVILDDLAIDFGVLRMKKKGGDGNHNGLSDIIEKLGRNDFARLRFGIGSDFKRGFQSEYVLGKWDKQESEKLIERIETAADMVKAFVSIGIDRAMAQYNNR